MKLRQRKYLMERSGDLEDLELQKGKLVIKALKAFPSSSVQNDIRDGIKKIETKIKKAREKRGVPNHYRFEPRKQKCINCGWSEDPDKKMKLWCKKWNAFVKFHYTCDDWKKS